MRWLLIGLGVVILGSAVIVLVTQVQSGAYSPEELRTLGIGNAFVAERAELEAQAEQAISEAREVIDERNNAANRVRFLTGILEWAGIILSGALVIVAAVFGRVMRPDDGPADAAETIITENKSKRRLTIVVAVIAAAASVSGMIASKLDAKEVNMRARVLRMFDEFQDARIQVIDHSTESELQDGIGRLERIPLQ